MLKALVITIMSFISSAFAADDTHIQLHSVTKFSMTINQQLFLFKNSQNLNLKGRNCEMRSLEPYTTNKIISNGALFELALKNYNPAAGSWTLIMRSFKQDVTYATIYCFNLDLNLNVENIEEDFNGAIKFSNISFATKEDWISNVSSFLFWRPSLAKASVKNRWPDQQKIAELSTVRNNRSVFKFVKKYQAISEDETNFRHDQQCIISTLYNSHRNKTFDRVGEYKIVNLDYNPQRRYLLIVGRNFFKIPMYSIIHCHDVGPEFTIQQLIQDLDQSISVHKISRPHW